MWPNLKFIVYPMLFYAVGYLCGSFSFVKENKRLRKKCEKLQKFIDEYGGDWDV